VVQVVYLFRRGSLEVEDVGFAYDDVEDAALMAATRQRLAGRGSKRLTQLTRSLSALSANGR
jgi:hypothetical protein